MFSYSNLKYSKKHSNNIVILFIIGLLSAELCYSSSLLNDKGFSLHECSTHQCRNANENLNLNTDLHTDLNADVKHSKSSKGSRGSKSSKSQSANSIACQKVDWRWLFIYSYTNLHTKDNGRLREQFKQFEKKTKQVDKNSGCSCSRISSLKEKNFLEHNGLQDDKQFEKQTQKQDAKLKKKAIDFGFKFKQENMILIERGEFLKGTNKDCAILTDSESPAHYEYVKNKFYLDKYEVSNLDFSLFVLLTNYRTDAEKLNSSFVFEGLIDDELKFKIQNNEHDKFNYRIAQVSWWYVLENINWFKISKNNKSIFSYSIEELSRRFKSELYVDSKFSFELFNEWIKQYTNEIELLEHPVVYVSWQDAVEFCRFFGKRLPTELEWEFACKSDYKTEDALYAWGNQLISSDSIHFANLWQGEFPTQNTKEDGHFGTCSFRSLKEQTRSGFKHLIGNVWEWCSDDWSVKRRKNISKQSSIKQKVKKGGSFLCHHSYCNRYRCSSRDFASSNTAASNLGFRCAKDV